MSCGVCLGPLNWPGNPWECMLGTGDSTRDKIHWICGAPDESCQQSKKCILVQEEHFDRVKDYPSHTHKNTVGQKKQRFSWSKAMSPTSSCVCPTHKCSHEICWKYPSPVIELHHDPMMLFLHSYRIVQVNKVEWAWTMTRKIQHMK